MYNILWSFVLCIITFNYHVAAKLHLKIVNGSSAEDGEFPYMVQLLKSGNFTCAGSIIAPQWILTAGNCIEYGNITSMSIVYGTNKLYNYTGDGYTDSTIKVKQKYLHPDYYNVDSYISTNDVGIIELETEIPYNAKSQPINLPPNDNIPFHVKGVLTGWGHNWTHGSLVPYLQKISLELQTGEQCTDALNKVGTNRYNSTLMLCSENNRNGQCTGDSGGPYVINGAQYGIVSWSYKPCGSYPGVYSRISYPENLNWIKNITNL